MSFTIKTIKRRYYETFYFEFLHENNVYRFRDDPPDKKLDTILFLKGIKIPTIDFRITEGVDTYHIFRQYGIGLDSELISSCGCLRITHT
jgi:hypothetical protein